MKPVFVLQGVGIVVLAVCTLAKRGGEEIFETAPIAKAKTSTKAQEGAKFGQHANKDESDLMKPVDSKELSEAQIRAYIQKFGSVAAAEMKNNKILASISIAQGIIESRAGTSILAQSNNNHFGIKCFSRNCPKGHCSNFTDDHHKDFFRKFQTAEESWIAHSKFLQQERYKNLFLCGTNYQAWARGLREFGYATDPNYDKKLISVIERYQLYKLDKQ